MTTHLIVGAGASFAECKGAGLPEEACLPLISNFAEKMWADYSPVVVLSAFLAERGVETSPNSDLRALFFELENQGKANVEQFFEFAWNERQRFPGEWENLTYHGILRPMIDILSAGLWSTGIRGAPLKLSPTLAGTLTGGDVVLDLNYDTLFELGAEQAGKTLTFLPNKPAAGSILVAKPHGSLNMVVNEQRGSFTFGSLDFPGNAQPADGSRNYAGFVPPRLNKSYSQHPAASTILKSLTNLRPAVTTFWGVGYTDSDIDLMNLYAEWCDASNTIEVINPSKAVCDVVRVKHGDKVRHFESVEHWLVARH
jgi:hypothetical protein